MENKNRLKNFLNIPKLCLFVLFFFTIEIACVYRQEAYQIFDRFTLVDLFNNHLKQYNKKSCSLLEGPNCFQISKINDVMDSQYLKNIINKISHETKLNLEEVIKALKQELKKFKDQHKASMSEVFKFSPKIMMNLLLNFESFDETTKTRDVYMPEEKVVNFNVGYLKLNFKGKLRLTQDKDNSMKRKNIEGSPSGAYGVVEEKDLFIKFDKPVIVKYLYVRPHLSNKENKYRSVEMDVVGYRNEKMVFNSKMYLMPNNREWYKVTPNQSVIDILKLPKDFDVDDISIIHDSEYSGGSEENEQLTSILQNVIDELIDQTNKKNYPLDDL